MLYIRPFDLEQAWKEVWDGRHWALAKVFDTPLLSFGIDGGRIGKLAIWPTTAEKTLTRALYNFDQGLDFDRLDDGGRKFYEEILKAFA
ncbi:MAG TPA: hypothetical protein VIK33_17455 [Anaerolineae bacterium]